MDLTQINCMGINGYCCRLPKLTAVCDPFSHSDYGYYRKGRNLFELASNPGQGKEEKKEKKALISPEQKKILNKNILNHRFRDHLRQLVTI
uniref:Uncharacterized protein n=1 Tax=Strongyloides papillosus TaxID=174720 RepID=A0A0N5CIL2_STREA